MSNIYIALDGTEFSTKERAIEYQELKNSKDIEFAEQRIEFLLLSDISSKAINDISEFRKNCNHTYVKATAHADTGNYDRSQDSYWYTIECKCCNKRWDEDQSTSKYRSDDKNVEWTIR